MSVESEFLYKFTASQDDTLFCVMSWYFGAAGTCAKFVSKVVLQAHQRTVSLDFFLHVLHEQTYFLYMMTLV